jgi:hypothetical protein
MTVSHDLGRTYEGDADAPPSLSRYGKLAPQFGGSAAGQVRAECDRCGTHLLAVPHGDGSLEGTCPVCLNQQVTRVAVHHAAA